MHTQESLDALSVKADVVEAAEELGIATSGTRKEITARILENQVEPTPEPVPVRPAKVQSAPPLVQISARARKSAELTVGSYIGAANISKQIGKVIAALEAGLQVCIVEGEGNTRFAVSVSEKLFDVANSAEDHSPRTNGVIINLTRFLANKGLYPRG